MGEGMRSRSRDDEAGSLIRSRQGCAFQPCSRGPSSTHTHSDCPERSQAPSGPRWQAQSSHRTMFAIERARGLASQRRCEAADERRPSQPAEESSCRADGPEFS